MLSRRRFALAALSAPLALAAGPALAVEPAPYNAAAVNKAIAAGKPVVVHVYAPWCLQCRAQASVLAGLTDPAYGRIAFFRVDYDGQKDAVKALGDVSRSTLIAYKGGKEVGRLAWATSADDVTRLVKTAL